MIAFAPKNDEALNLVLVDIGNSIAKASTYIEGERGTACSAPTQPAGSVFKLIKEQWDALPKSMGRAVVVCSVCPPILNELRTLAEQSKMSPFLVIGEDLPVPIAADVPEPEKVGTDRLCNAAAAFGEYVRTDDP